MDELIHEFTTAVRDADGHLYTARAMERTRPRELVCGFGDVFDLQRVDRRRVDLDREELALAAATRHLEKTGLFVVPDLTHERVIQRGATGLAASGEPLSAVHDRPHRH